MTNVRYMHVSTDLFNEHRIKLIESMDEGDSVLLIWFKLVWLAGKVDDNGLIYLTKEMPYTDEMLAVMMGKSKMTVCNALEILKKYELIKVVDGNILVCDWKKYVDVESVDEQRRRCKEIEMAETQAEILAQLTNIGKR